MKSLHTLTVLIIFVWLQCQVTAVQSSDWKNGTVKELSEQGNVEQNLARLVHALTSLKDGVDIQKYRKLPVNQYISNLVKRLFKSCNIDKIENKIEDLLNTTVDFVTDISEPLEDICSQVYQCANDRFPQSFGCFLDLPRKCQSSMQEIQESLNNFIPEANVLLLSILKDVVNCLP